MMAARVPGSVEHYCVCQRCSAGQPDRTEANLTALPCQAAAAPSNASAAAVQQPTGHL